MIIFADEGGGVQDHSYVILSFCEEVFLAKENWFDKKIEGMEQNSNLLLIFHFYFIFETCYPLPVLLNVQSEGNFLIPSPPFILNSRGWK